MKKIILIFLILSININLFSQIQINSLVASKTAICQGESIDIEVFYINETGVVSYEWYTEFSPTIFGTTKSITISPSTTTKYFVKVIDDNSNALDYVTIVVNPKPIANFEVVDNELCFNEKFKLKNTSTLNTDTTWFFDGGNPTFINDSVYIYFNSNITKNYTVGLKVKSDKGCFSNLKEFVLKVDEKPIVNQIIPETTLCFGNNFILKDSIKILNTTTHINWGDGLQKDSLINCNKCEIIYNHKFITNKDSIYNFIYYNKTDKGCVSDTLNKNLIIEPTPIIDFTVSEDTLCFGNAFEF